MITPNEKSIHRWDFKRYTEILYTLIGCITLIVALSLLEISQKGHFSLDNATPWYGFIDFFAIILAFSIFLISYYTYHQIQNSRLAVVGFTFLIVGVFDAIPLLTCPYIYVPYGMEAVPGKAVIYLLLARLLNAAGLLILVSMPENRKGRLGREWRLVLSLLVISAVIMLVESFPGAADYIYGPEGMKPVGNLLMGAAGLLYAYNTCRAIIDLGKNGDSSSKTMACAFILMLFSQIITIGAYSMNDVRHLLGCILKLLGFMLFFNIFFIHGIRRPYVLLSKAKEELNEYAYELDRLVDKRTYELKQVNKRLMADLDVARGIQHAMLPSTLPQNEFVSFVSGYLPAENLSGDFYNVIKIDDTQYGIYIGDVSGHGVSAAMLTVFTFQRILSLMDEIGKEGMTIPAMVLKHLYDSFNAANFSEELYIVLIYGVYNTETGIFSYASGGLNTSPLRLRPDGSIQ